MDTYERHYQEQHAKARATLKRLFDAPKDCPDRKHNAEYGGFINTFAINPSATIPQKLKSQRWNSSIDLLRNVPDNANVYYTRNTTQKRFRHGNDILYNYRNIVMDIDAHDIPAFQSLNIATEAAVTIQKEVNNKKFKGLEPNVIIMTGRGLQVIWSIEPMRGANQKNEAIYMILAARLCNFMTKWLEEHPQFSQLELDIGASKKSSGLVRLPGSYNINAYTELRKEFSDETAKDLSLVRVYNPHRITKHLSDKLLESLADYSDGESDVDNFNEFSDIMPTSDEGSVYNMTQLECIARYNSVYSLLDEKYGAKGIPKGMRDITVFVMGNLALKFMSERKALQKIACISDYFFQEPFTKKEIEQYLSTSMKIHNSDGLTGYKLTNKQIEKMLHFPSNSIPVFLDFEKIKRIRAEVKRKNAIKRAMLHMKALLLYDSGLTYEAVGDIMGKTRQTISKWVKLAREALARVMEDQDATTKITETKLAEAELIIIEERKASKSAVKSKTVELKTYQTATVKVESNSSSTKSIITKVLKPNIDNVA